MKPAFISIVFGVFYLLMGCRSPNERNLVKTFMTEYEASSRMENTFAPPSELYDQYMSFHPTRRAISGSISQQEFKVEMAYRLVVSNLGGDVARSLLNSACRKFGINQAYLDINQGLFHSVAGVDFGENKFLRWMHGVSPP